MFFLCTITIENVRGILFFFLQNLPENLISAFSCLLQKNVPKQGSERKIPPLAGINSLPKGRRINHTSLPHDSLKIHRLRFQFRRLLPSIHFPRLKTSFCVCNYFHSFNITVPPNRRVTLSEPFKHRLLLKELRKAILKQALYPQQRNCHTYVELFKNNEFSISRDVLHSSHAAIALSSRLTAMHIALRLKDTCRLSPASRTGTKQGTSSNYRGN